MAISIKTVPMVLPLLFRRNQAVLVELLDEREALGHSFPFGTPLSTRIRRFYQPNTLVKWKESDEWWAEISEDFQRVRRVYADSGWEVFLQRISQELKQPLITREYAAEGLTSLAFSQGRTLMLLPGSINSAVGHRLSRLPHPAIIKGQPYVSDRRVHLLVEPLDIQDKLSNFLGEGEELPVSQLMDLITQLNDVYVYAAKQGQLFSPADDALLLREGDKLKVAIYPASRASGGALATESEARISLRNWFFNSGDVRVEPKLDDLGAATNYMNWRGGGAWRSLPIRTDYPRAPPEYRLPEIQASELARAEQWVARLKADNPSRYAMAVEPLMALLSRGFGRQLDESKPSLKAASDIYKLFMDNLQHFGYLRRPSYAATLPGDLKLLHYQADRNRLEELDQLSVLDHSIPNAALPVRMERTWQPLLRSGRDAKRLDPARWSLKKDIGFEEELPLERKKPPREATITLHGVELDTQELQVVLYNTILGAAIEDGTLEWDPAWLTAADVLLLQDLVEGRIMPHVFYMQLSSSGYNVLMTPRSYLDLYELPQARLAINIAFVLGVPPHQQFQSAAESFRNAEIPRLAELAA